MAKHCNLAESQIEDLFKATYGSILASKKNNQKYNPKQFIKDIYNMMFDASKDQSTALDYVQHIPKMINISQANDDDVSDHLLDSGVSMDELIKLRKDFDTSIEKVIEYLELNNNKELETVIEIVDASPAGSLVTNTQEYSEVETNDKKIKETSYRKTYVVASDGTLTFIAKPETGLALINQEAQNYGGVKAEQNIVDSDVKKRNYFSVVRNINNLINGPNADDLTLGDVTGIYLRAIPTNQIAFEDLYTEQQEYFNRNDKDSTSEEKLKKRETGEDILMVYTDKKGNILYFNENGIPTTKENGGTIAYATIRKVNVDNKGKRFIRSVQSITDLSNKLGAESVEDIINNRDSEMDTLQAMREYAVKNPNEVLLFSIAPGKNGYIKEDFSKRNSISGIQLESGFNPFYSSIDDGPFQKGGVYFTVPDYDLPVLIRRPRFSEIPNFVENLAKIVFDSKLPTENKISILKQFTYSEDTGVFERDGKVVIKQGTDTLNTDVVEDRQKFINNLNNQVVNINKYLLGKDFQMPTDSGKVESKKYNNFLSENFYTNLQKNDDNKLIKLNAYNILQPTMDASEKMFKVEEIPNTIEGSSIEQATPTDQSDDDFDNAIKGFDFGLKKLAILGSAATQQQITDAKTWYESSPLNKLMPFKEMFNVVNSDARAMFTKSGVTLFSGSNYTDLYHEGWHVFSQMFLTKDQKKKLYSELRNLSGKFTTVKGDTKSFKDATDFEIEEFAAEDFRKYVLSKGKKIIDGRPTRNNIFKRIYNFLKTLFTGQSVKNYLLNEEATGTLKDLYDKLYVGQLNEYKPTLRNVQFTQLNKGAQELGAAEGENKGLNYQDSMVLNETIDYLMASILQEKKLGVGALFINSKLMGPLYVEIKKRLSKLAQNKSNTNPVLQGNQQEQLNKFKELQERLNNKEFLEGAKFAYESSTQGTSGIGDVIKELSKLIEGKKEVYTLYDFILKQDSSKNGYKLTIPEFPNVVLYITQENASSENIKGSTEFNTKNKDWTIEILHPTKGVMRFPKSIGVTNKKDVIEDFITTINEKHSKSENGRKILSEVGIALGAEQTNQQSQSLKDIGTQEQYNDYIARVSLGIIRNPSSGEFNNSAVKDIVYRGGEKEDSKLFQYWTKNPAEAYMYAKANITKGGNITERNPLKSINKIALDYFDTKYGKNTYSIISLNKNSSQPEDWMMDFDKNGEPFIKDEYLEVLKQVEKDYSNQPFVLKKLSEKDKELLKNIQTVFALYNYVKIESESDLMKQYDDTDYMDNIDKYKKARKYIDENLDSKKIRDTIGKITTAIINITNPYKEEIVQEDLQNDRDAYKNGHDGAFLMDGDHFVIKNNSNQSYELGGKQDIQGFKEFVTQPSTSVKEGDSNPADFTNHSGGAYGGDTFWDIIGREFGVTKHMHYKDAGNANLSQKLKNAKVEATILTKEQMDNARAEVERLLGQKYSDTLEGNLQVRNYYQVANADSVFAVAPLSKDLKSVTGGTNTAVQLGIKLNKPVYVFDLNSEKWYQFQNNIFTETTTPILTKNFAGVGSRDIESYNTKDKVTGEWKPRKQYLGAEKEAAAKQAIRDVYQNTFKSTQPSTNVKPTIDTSREWSGDLKTRPVYTTEGVNTMRTQVAETNEHFGNPFSEAGYGNTIKVNSIADAVIAYKDWLLNGVTLVKTTNKVDLNTYLKPFEAQRTWILNQINQGKLDGATLLYAGKSEARGKGMHPTALAEVVEQLRSTQSSTSVNPLVEAGVKPTDMYGNAAKDIQMAEELSKITESGTRILQFALDNWGDFNKVVSGEQANGIIAFHKQRSKFLSFDEKYSELSPAEQDDVDGEINLDSEDNPMAQTEAQNREMFGERAFERKGTEHSVKSLASNEVVYLIKSLPKLDKQGKIKYNSIGTPKLADFNRTWGIVINTVVGSVNKSEMYNRLLKAADVFPELKILADRLQRPSSKVDPKTDNPFIQMWGAFFRDFSMYKIPIKELQIIKTTNSKKDGFNFQVRYVESEPVFKQVENNFINSFQTAVTGKYINKVDGINYLDLTKVFEDFPTTASLSEGNNAFQFLRVVGFNLTDNSDVKKNIVKQEVKTHINYIYLRFKDSINFKNIDNPINFLNSNRTDGNFKGRNNSTDVQSILEVEGRYSTNYSNNSITNVDGNLEHDISLNNSITQLFKELNDPNKKTYQELVSQPHMAHLNIQRNPHAKYNMLFNSMFELPLTYKEVTASNLGQRRTIAVSGGIQPIVMNFDNINGIKSILDIVAEAAVNQGGIKTTNLDPNSKFLQDLHTMLESGVMELTRRGSKSSAFGASVTEINSPHNEHSDGKVTAKHLYISSGYFFNKVTPSDPKGSILGYNYAVDIIKEQIAAEMERIAILKEDIENKGELSKIPGFNKRGLTFTMFDDILSKSLKKDLIDKADAKNSYQVVNSDEFRQRISDDVITYLEKLTKENMEFFNEMPYLSDQLKNTLDKLGKAAGTIGENATIGQGKEAAVKSFTVNALIHNMQMIGLVDGDLAMYNHDKEEYNKRNASVTSTGRIFSADKSDFMFINNLRAGKTYANKIGAAKRDFNGVLNTAIFKDNEIGSVYYKEYFDALMSTKKYTEAQVKKILKNYSPGKMNEGDAQGWITFDAYRELALLEGNAWSPKQDELYAKIVAGDPVDPTEIAEFFPPRKYQYAGPLQTNNLHIQAFHKYSLVPLVPSVIKSTNMKILHDNLVKQGFDYALFESGSKMATMTKDGNPAPLYKDNNRTIEEWDGTEESKYASNPIFIQYLKNQVDIAPTWKNKTIFSTQLRKLIINDIFKKGVAKNAGLENLVNEFEGLLTTLQSYKRQELLEEIGWTKNAKGEAVGDKKKLIEFVRKEIARQDFADHDIEFIDLDASGNLKNDLSLSLNAEKIEKLLNSIVIKRLVRQKMNGEQLVQISSAGFESSNRSAFNKASEEDILKYRGTNDLPAYRPGKGKGGATTAMKVKIAMKGDYYKLLELNDNNGKKIETIERLNVMLKSDKWLDKEENRKLITMVGVRIPVQGLNSMEFMEIYEFLPEEAGNIIIPASEIVAKSGSDFDIDKLTIFQPNYSSSKKYASYSKGDNAKGTENQVIEVIRKILEHPDNFDSLIRPNDTDLVKGTADELVEFNIQGYDPIANKSQGKRTVEKNGKTVNVISPTKSLEQRYNLYKHESNNVGKKTLGIGAVDNSYSSIFKRIGAYLLNSYTYRTAKRKGSHEREVYIAMEHNSQIKDGKKYISLSDVNTTTMDKVSDLISQLMNGWVDVEKDAWIFNINGNDVAGPVMLFLLEAGVDFKTAAYFISQPLIIDYIKERSRSQSPFYQASDSGVLNTRTKNSLPKGQKGLDKYNIRKEFIREYVSSIPVNPKNGNEMFSAEIMYNQFIKSNTAGVTFSPNELLGNIKTQDKDSDISRNTLMHFFELEDMMRDLTNVKLTMNVDTSPSKTFFDAQSKIIAIDNLRKTDIVSQDLINDIKFKSPIASFFTQAFQLNLFKPMMKIRADKMVNDFLIETVESDPNDIMSTTFKDDPEKFVASFKNDIPLFMLQNYIKGIDLTTLKEYKSLAFDKSTPVTEIPQLKYGAFVKDGVMYVDADQINKDFDNKAFAGEGYAQNQLHQLNPGTFSMSGNRQVDLQEYAHFVLERETLRANALAGVTSTQEVVTFDQPKGEMVKDGIYVNQEGLTKEEQLELFAFLKPILENQALRSNAGKFAPKMVGLELNWDYVNGSTKRKDKGYNRIDIKDPLRPNNTYGWFEKSATGLPLEKMSARFKDLMSKAVGIDVSDYDGSIVNIYNDDSFIGNHPDIDESKTAAKYPVVVANIGGTGNIVLGTNKDKSSVDLKSGAGYLFGFQGKNRTIPHSTYASSTNGFLPAITTEIDGETYAAGSYRISITMRRVKPLTAGMSSEPAVLSQKGQADKSPLVEKQSRASFEKEIANKALINTYNFYTLLKSPTSNANLFLHAATKYSKELPGEYAIFDQVVPDKGFKDKGIKTLKFKSGKVEKDMTNILHENLIRLADPDTVKIKDPKANAELSRFFGRFIISEYLRSGINKTNDSLAPILPTDVLMQLLKEPMKNGVNEQMIAEYAQLFKNNWSVNKKKTRNKFRNYIKPKVVELPSIAEIDDYSLVRENNNGLNVFTAPAGIEAARELVAKNPQYTLLYGGNAENLNEPKSDEFQKGHSLSIPVKPGRGITMLWSDKTFDSNIEAISKALNAIDDAKTNGQDIAFPEEGFTTVVERKDLLDSDGNPVKENGKTVKRFVPKDILIGNAPRTFEYLAVQLYSRYGYVHPGAENMLGFRTLYQKGQSITDEMVDDFMKKCFGN